MLTLSQRRIEKNARKKKKRNSFPSNNAPPPPQVFLPFSGSDVQSLREMGGLRADVISLSGVSTDQLSL